MSSTALAPRNRAGAPLAGSGRGLHARVGGTPGIRVIPGGLIREEELPLHARALRLKRAPASAESEQTGLSSGPRRLSGLGFGLAPRDRRLAWASGALLAAVALAAAIL